MRWSVRLFAVVAALASFVPCVARAQVIRGLVTERISGQPLAGVLITVAAVPDSLRPDGLRYSLTNTRGEYAVALSSGGTFVVSAKRIGVARHTTAPFRLGAGESRRVDLVLDPFESKLPVVSVVSTNLCFRKPEQQRTIVALLDEVRTALRATEVTRDGHFLSGWLSRYVRSLEPRSLRILEDRRSVAEGHFDRPMRSISGDSLARVGYWRRQDADTLVFYAPDEEALLSSSFTSGHCFELATATGARRGLIGLAFRPRVVRNTGGINGTIWIDAGNFELRFVEFRYTNLITIPANPHIGGEVHYLRDPSGAWLVRRWFVRMPLFPEVVPVAVARAGVVSGTPQPYVYRLIEEGGGLFTPGLRTWEVTGTILGIVTDSTGMAPLHGTRVSLSGTPYSEEVDTLGGFRFDSIPPGAYTLLASHRAYADLGQLVDDEPLNLSAGQTYRATLRAIGTAELLSILCDGKKFAPPLATLRVVAMHADGGGPLGRLPLWLRWPDPEEEAPRDPITPGKDVPLLGIESMTDETGAVTFCGVPAGSRVELVMLRSDDDPSIPRAARVVRVTTFVLKPGEVASRTISVVPPR